MANISDQERRFNFKFNLHKTVFSIGIEDDDYARLQAVYNVDSEWMQLIVSEFAQSNALQAQCLKEKYDLSALDTRPLKILFLGDSNTSNRQSHLNILKAATKEYPWLQLVDRSVSGYKSGDLFTAIHPGLLGEHADIAHIMIGSNDFRRIIDPEKLYHTSPAEFEKNVDYVVSALIKDSSRVIITTIPPFSKKKADNHFAKSNGMFDEEDRQLYNNILEKIAQRYGAYLNQMDTLYAQYTPEALTLPDGIHLNELGHSVLAQGVVCSVLNLIDMGK